MNNKRKGIVYDPFDFRHISNCLSDPVYLVLANGEIIFQNEASANLNIIAEKPVSLGNSIYDFFPPEEKEQFRFLFETSIIQNKRQATEMELPHPNAYNVYLKIDLLPICDDGSSIKYICVFISDITSQKSVKGKIETTVKELSSLIENVNMIIFDVDGQGYLTRWNNAAETLTGFTRTEIFTKNYLFLFKEEERNKLIELTELVQKGIIIGPREIKMKGKDGKTSTLLFNILPKTSSLNQVIGATYVGQDISELSEYKEQLEVKVEDRTNKLKEALEKEKELVAIRNKFISIATHEFKIPLATIGVLTTELLNNEKRTSQELEKLNTIILQVSFMKTMLQDVLLKNKREQPKIKSIARQVKFNAFLSNICKEVMAATGHSNPINQFFPDKEVALLSDETLLRNIFINLLSNAVKFSPVGKEVQCRLTATNESVQVEIKDFGIGIDESDQKRIFEPFNRGNNAGSVPGTGLGLSIVKRAIDALSGRITLESKAGEFTSFKVVFNLS